MISIIFKNYRSILLLAAEYTIVDAPFHFSIKALKALRFSVVLILKGRVFLILGP